MMEYILVCGTADMASSGMQLNESGLEQQTECMFSLGVIMQEWGHVGLQQYS